MRALIFLVLAIGAAQAFADEGSTRAGPQEGRFYINGAAAWYSPADATFTEDPLGGAVMLGYGLTDRWSMEVMYSQFDVDYRQGAVSGADTTRLGWLDLLYEIRGNETWQPFLLVGAGRANAGRDALGDIKETQLNLGLGVFRALNDRFSLRGDIRAVYGDEEHDVEPFATLGLTAVLGRLNRAEPVMVAAAPLDSDGDGVTDEQDRCPGTAAAAIVDQAGCELDDDRDGVVNSADECPDTPARAAVDERGCAMTLDEVVTIDLALEFDSNSAELREAHGVEIERAVEFLLRYPNSTAVIEGHTDSDGDADYNQQLSQRRANAVLDYLTAQDGIAANRLSAVGYGESRPVADNATAAGKQANRRVAVVITGSESVLRERED